MKLLLIVMLSIFNCKADSKYERALLYLNGEKGSSKIVKKAPRCPYERCKGDKEYIYIRKDKRTAYRLLKEASSDDSRASHKALKILLKQVDYKSKEYDDYLMKKLKKDFGINTKDNYDKDIQYFMRTLINSDNKIHKCDGAFMMFNSLKNSYFQIKSNKLTSKKMKQIILENCEPTNFNYIMINNEEIR